MVDFDFSPQKYLRYIGINSKLSPNLESIGDNSYVEISQIPDMNNKRDGLFARYDLKAGTVICSSNSPQSRIFNDGCISLSAIVQARDHQEMFDAWLQAAENYYTSKSLRRVNVHLCTFADGRSFYQTLKAVSKGEELLRAYGFSTWFFEILDVINDATVCGFAKFVKLYYDNLPSIELYKDKIVELLKYLDDITGMDYTVDLSSYNGRIFKYNSDVLTSDNMPRQYPNYKIFHRMLIKALDSQDEEVAVLKFIKYYCAHIDPELHSQLGENVKILAKHKNNLKPLLQEVVNRYFIATLLDNNADIKRSHYHIRECLKILYGR